MHLAVNLRPADAAIQRVFALPVSLVPGLPTGTGIVLVRKAVTIATDTTGVAIAWGSMDGLRPQRSAGPL